MCARTLHDWRRDVRARAPTGAWHSPGTPYLAGSSLTLDRAIGNTVRFTGLPLEAVIAMASTIPCPLSRDDHEWDGER